MRLFTNRITAVVFSGALLGSLIYAYAETRHRGPMNGFDVNNALIPVEEIMHGGPERDGIPAIDDPEFLAAGKADFLAPEDEVLGIAMGLRARAYPIRILNWHEIVNDRIGNQAVTVTFCPLCGTGVAFSSMVQDKVTTFGVSGLLYNSDVLLYDRETESLWSQIMGQAIAGPLAGNRLLRVPVTHTTWRDWRQRYPDTRVLSTDTGYSRDYAASPYSDYEDNPRLYFPVSSRDMRMHPKERVIGIEIDGRYKAYPFMELAKSGTGARDSFAGKELMIRFDADNRTGEVKTAQGKPVTQMIAYWFAWAAFHPDTEVYTAEGE